MRSLTALVLLSLLIAGATNPAFAQPSCRVLFLGNSVFYFKGGIYQTFEGFCNAAGVGYEAYSQRNAPAHAHGVDFLEYGRIPHTLPEVAADSGIHEFIRTGSFDYVILEARREGYLLPAWVERTDDYRTGDHIPYEENSSALQSLHRTIVQSGAKTVLYMHPGLRDKPEWRHVVAQLYYRLKSDLENMKIKVRTHDVMLIPASLLWDDALNRYGVDAWYDDYMHGKKIARYASGCMVFAYLTGMDPRSIDFRELPRDWKESGQVQPDQLSEEDAGWIAGQVWLYYSTKP